MTPRNGPKIQFVAICITLIFSSLGLGNTHRHSSHRHHKGQNTEEADVGSSNKIVAKLLSDIEARPVREDLHSQLSSQLNDSIEVDANKISWLQQVYRMNLVEASSLTALLADKLLQYKVLSHFLEAKTNHFMFHTMGLKEFILKHQLADPEGELIPDTDRFEEALAEEFPNGFVVRPALGISPAEKKHGIYASSDDFLKEIFRPHNALYQAQTLHLKIKSHFLNRVASGEAIVLQDDFSRSYVASQNTPIQKIKFRKYEKIRLHCFENKVVESAIPELWVAKRQFEMSDDQTHQIEAFVQDFLDSLPIKLTTRQAWGVDVALLDNGEMKILDLITNQGVKTAWSAYLDEPKILGAYTRHLEKNLNLKFQGLNGFIFRNNLANFFNYWQLKKERANLGGVSQITASLPPWPF